MTAREVDVGPIDAMLDDVTPFLDRPACSVFTGVFRL
jgi:hypothetical protein